MIRLIRALSSLHGEQYTEPYIAKAQFERYGNLVGENIQTKMTVEKEKAKFVLIIIDLYNEKIVLARLRITLFLHATENAVLTVHHTKPTDVQIWRSFSKESIYAFSEEANDTNPIHLTDRPIVQGLFLLRSLAEYFGDIHSLEMKFIKPLYADQIVYLQKHSGSFVGYHDHEIIFKGKVEFEK